MDNTSLADMVEAAIATADDGLTPTVTSEKAAKNVLWQAACHCINVRSLAPRFWMRSTVERLC